MSYGGAERRALQGPQRQQRDFVVEIDKTLDDDLAGIAAPAGLRVPPRLLDAVLVANDGLSLAGTAHHRFDDTRHPDRLDRPLECLETVGKLVRRRRHAERLRGEPTNTLAVHRQSCRARGWYHAQTVALHLDEHLRRNRFDLGYDEIRFFGKDQRAQRIAVEHVDDVAAMSDLHRRRVCITIDRNHLDAEPLQLDRHLFAEFSRPQQHHACGARAEWRTNRRHQDLLKDRRAAAASVHV